MALNDIRYSGIFFIVIGIIGWIYTVWYLKSKRIPQLVPEKDWRILKILFYWGLLRHDKISAENHPRIYWFSISSNIILNTFLIIFGTWLLFFFPF